MAPGSGLEAKEAQPRLEEAPTRPGPGGLALGDQQTLLGAGKGQEGCPGGGTAQTRTQRKQGEGPKGRSFPAMSAQRRHMGCLNRALEGSFCQRHRRRLQKRFARWGSGLGLGSTGRRGERAGGRKRPENLPDRGFGPRGAWRCVGPVRFSKTPRPRAGSDPTRAPRASPPAPLGSPRPGQRPPRSCPGNLPAELCWG